MGEIKKRASATKNQQTKEYEKGSLDDVTSTSVKVFEGVFAAWGRKVPSKDDPKVIVNRFKCVCQKTLKNGDTVDISAWISEAQAQHFGIEHGSTFLGKFAYEDIDNVSPKGQYNEERGLHNARLIGVA